MAFDPSAMQTDDRDDDDDDKPKTFEEMFKLFVKMKDPKADGTKICLTSSNKWMKNARIIDGMKVTETDTGVAFFKFKRSAINMEQYLLFLQDLCEKKGLDYNEIKKKMTECGDPRKEKKVKVKRNEFLARKSTDEGK